MAGAIGFAYAVFLFVWSAPPQSGAGAQRPRTPAERAALKKRPARPVSIGETRPKAGKNNLLPTSAITYCLAENVRLEAGRAVVSGPADEERFDALVKDYNSRCAEYQYRQSDYNYAKSIVEEHRSGLKRDGARRFERPAETAPEGKKR